MARERSVKQSDAVGLILVDSSMPRGHATRSLASGPPGGLRVEGRWQWNGDVLHLGGARLVDGSWSLPASLYAQETRGKISGRVTDASAAAIPGATVTVTDVARGTTASTVTNNEGLFQVNYLLPGTYTVTIELRDSRRPSRRAFRSRSARRVDLTIVLEVGGIQEAISVTAEVATVNTSDANMGLVVDQMRLASLPLIHGDPYKIMGLATGLTHTGDQRLDRPFEPTHIIGYAMDGTRGNRSDLLIDGAPSTATANANEVIATYVPQSDMVQEFRVQTATFDAQFGNTEGGVTSMSIRSGTNRFHGTGYYFAEPSSMGANDFFGKARGPGEDRQQFEPARLHGPRAC